MNLHLSDATSAGDRSKEETLIARCQAGDTGAFRQLVDQYQQYAFALAFRVVCDEDDAKDVVQEAFIRVWRSFRSFDPRKRFGTWLYRIVANLAYDVIRMERRKRRLFSPSVEEEDASVKIDRDWLENVVSNRDLAEKIESLAGGLSPKQRIVFVLRDLQEMTMEEIAESLDMSISSVKANLCYARREIRAQLERMTK